MSDVTILVVQWLQSTPKREPRLRRGMEVTVGRNVERRANRIPRSLVQEIYETVEGRETGQES